MLHRIGQRPLGAGRHLNVAAGHEGDRGRERDRLWVDQPQQDGERMSLPSGCLPSPRTTAVDFHSGTGARQVRDTGRVPPDKAVPSSRNSSSAAPPTRANRIWAIPPGESDGYAPPATRARACARRGPLHGTREWIARVPVKRLDRGTHRLSRRSCA
jgi:hypothetical protein